MKTVVLETKKKCKFLEISKIEITGESEASGCPENLQD